MTNKYFETVQIHLNDVLEVLKNDEALCHMLVDMVNNKCNINETNWLDQRHEFLCNNKELSDKLINQIIPNDDCTDVPEYMQDFYEETTLSNEWLWMNDSEKLSFLNKDIENYMNSFT